MKISRGRVDGRPSEARSENFTGTVWGDPVLQATDGVLVNNVANDERHDIADVTPADFDWRIAVNLRLTEPQPIANLPIDHFDGLEKWEDLPRDGRCIRDLWF